MSKSLLHRNLLKSRPSLFRPPASFTTLDLHALLFRYLQSITPQDEVSKVAPLLRKILLPTTTTNTSIETGSSPGVEGTDSEDPIQKNAFFEQEEWMQRTARLAPNQLSTILLHAVQATLPPPPRVYSSASQSRPSTTMPPPILPPFAVSSSSASTALTHQPVSWTYPFPSVSLLTNSRNAPLAAFRLSSHSFPLKPLSRTLALMQHPPVMSGKIFGSYAASRESNSRALLYTSDPALREQAGAWLEAYLQSQTGTASLPRALRYQAAGKRTGHGGDVAIGRASAAPLLPSLTSIRGVSAGVAGATRGLVTGAQQLRHLVKLKGTWSHLGPIYSVAFDPSGLRVVTGSDDFLVKIWSLQTGALLASCRGHIKEIADVSISPDASLIASADTSGLIRLWDFQGHPLTAFAAHTSDVQRLVFCPMHLWRRGVRLLYSTSLDGTMRIFNLNDPDSLPVPITHPVAAEAAAAAANPPVAVPCAMQMQAAFEKVLIATNTHITSVSTSTSAAAVAAAGLGSSIVDADLTSSATAASTAAMTGVGVVAITAGSVVPDSPHRPGAGGAFLGARRREREAALAEAERFAALVSGNAVSQGLVPAAARQQHALGGGFMAGHVGDSFSSHDAASLMLLEPQAMTGPTWIAARAARLASRPTTKDPVVYTSPEIPLTSEQKERFSENPGLGPVPARLPAECVALAISPCGRLAAVGGNDGVVRILTAMNPDRSSHAGQSRPLSGQSQSTREDHLAGAGQLLATLEAEGEIVMIRFNAAGDKLLALTTVGTIRVWMVVDLFDYVTVAKIGMQDTATSSSSSSSIYDRDNDDDGADGTDRTKIRKAFGSGSLISTRRPRQAHVTPVPDSTYSTITSSVTAAAIIDVDVTKQLLSEGSASHLRFLLYAVLRPERVAYHTHSTVLKPHQVYTPLSMTPFVIHPSYQVGDVFVRETSETCDRDGLLPLMYGLSQPLTEPLIAATLSSPAPSSSSPSSSSSSSSSAPCLSIPNVPSAAPVSIQLAQWSCDGESIYAGCSDKYVRVYRVDADAESVRHAVRVTLRHDITALEKEIAAANEYVMQYLSSPGNQQLTFMHFYQQLQQQTSDGTVKSGPSYLHLHTGKSLPSAPPAPAYGFVEWQSSAATHSATVDSSAQPLTQLLFRHTLPLFGQSDESLRDKTGFPVSGYSTGSSSSSTSASSTSTMASGTVAGGAIGSGSTSSSSSGSLNRKKRSGDGASVGKLPSEPLAVLSPHPKHPELVMIASGDGIVSLYDALSGACIRSIKETAMSLQVDTSRVNPEHRQQAETILTAPFKPLDADWSPAGDKYFITSEYGRALILGLGSRDAYVTSPGQQYLASDFQPVLVCNGINR